MLNFRQNNILHLEYEHEGNFVLYSCMYIINIKKYIYMHDRIYRHGPKNKII